jgi:hypothetical protein
VNAFPDSAQLADLRRYYPIKVLFLHSQCLDKNVSGSNRQLQYGRGFILSRFLLSGSIDGNEQECVPGLLAIGDRVPQGRASLSWQNLRFGAGIVENYDRGYSECEGLAGQILSTYLVLVLCCGSEGAIVCLFFSVSVVNSWQ